MRDRRQDDRTAWDAGMMRQCVAAPTQQAHLPSLQGLEADHRGGLQAQALECGCHQLCTASVHSKAAGGQAGGPGGQGASPGALANAQAPDTCGRSCCKKKLTSNALGSWLKVLPEL